MGDAIKFLSEVRLELSKVAWPKLNEFIGSTVIVLVLVALFAFYLFVVDYGFTKLMSYIFSIYGVYR